jgi:hypothetical protein
MRMGPPRRFPGPRLSARLGSRGTFAALRSYCLNCHAYSIQAIPKTCPDIVGLICPGDSEGNVI